VNSDRSEAGWAARAAASPGGVGHLLSVALALAAILYVAVFFGARTEGFRSVLRDRLEEYVGVPVRIERSLVTPALDLVLVGVSSATGQAERTSAFHAREAVIKWSPSALVWRRVAPVRAVELDGLSVSFASDGRGGWEPGGFTALGDRLAEWGGFDVEPEEAEEPAAAAGGAGAAAEAGGRELDAAFWESARVTLRNGSMEWRGLEGERLAAIEGVDLEVSPVELPNRRMTHYYLRIGKASAMDRGEMRDFLVELIHAGSNRILLAFSGGWTRRNAGEAREERAPGERTPPY
jgi:hypothetical protein